MAVAVQCHVVPRGDDLRRERRSPLNLLADEEESRRRLGLGKSLENSRRSLWVRTVIEGEPDSAGVTDAIPHAQRPPHERNADRGCRRVLAQKAHAVMVNQQCWSSRA